MTRQSESLILLLSTDTQTVLTFLFFLPFAHLMQLYSEGQVKFNYQKKKEKREKNKNRRRPPFRVLITQLQGRSVGFI